MTVTDQELLNQTQAHLLETQDLGLTVSSGLWTVAEMISYANNRQRQFLKDTAILLKRTPLVTTPNVNRQPLPSDCVEIARISWQGNDGTFREVARADSLDSDMNLPSWELESGPTPREYSETEDPSLEIRVAPAPSIPGVLTALHSYLGTTLSNSGISLTVPDEFYPAVLWGTIADMLSKVGRGQDLTRAGYAESRYAEGVAAAAVMLNGFA